MSQELMNGQVGNECCKPWSRRLCIEVAPVLTVLKHVIIVILPYVHASTWYRGDNHMGSIVPHHSGTNTPLCPTYVESVHHQKVTSHSCRVNPKSRWKQMSHILRRTHRTLNKCKVSVAMFDESMDIEQALLDVFVALVMFCAESSKQMREMNTGNPKILGGCAQLTASFQKKLQSISGI